MPRIKGQCYRSSCNQQARFKVGYAECCLRHAQIELFTLTLGARMLGEIPVVRRLD